LAGERPFAATGVRVRQVYRRQPRSDAQPGSGNRPGWRAAPVSARPGSRGGLSARLSDANSTGQRHGKQGGTTMISRRSALRLGFGAPLLGLIGGRAVYAADEKVAGEKAAGEKIMLKASDVHPEGYPTVQAVEDMGKKLAAATDGRLTIQMYASMQLGGEKEAIEQAQVGAIQLARVSVGTLGPVVPELNVFNLPFLFRDTAHMEKVIDGPIGRQLLDKVTDNPNTHLVGLAWMDAGARNFYDTKKPIKSIDDLKNLKIRVMGNPMFVEMMTDLGGNGVAMGYDQVFSALQTGVVDGAENNPPSFYFDNHYQVAKYYTLTEHLIVPEILVFSRPSWDKLSADDQALIRKLAREAQLDERVLWKKKEAEAIDKMKAAGIEIVTIADKTPFQQAVKPVWDKYGAQYAALIKEIEAVN
jgi:tripartite ATP-independent transporter DctP family solute receptor